MSGDETLVLLLAGITACFGLWRWYASVAGVTRIGTRGWERLAVTLAPLAALAVLLVVLRSWSSWDVRDSATYTFFYVVLGVFWFCLVGWLLPFTGFHPRDDVVERHNVAAAPVVFGAMLGGTVAFAGGNVGDGPGWWVVVFSAVLATGALLLLAVAVDRLVHVADAVTVERDLASGIRHGALFVAMGLVLGRAVAGDWKSVARTTEDFGRVGWPAAAIALLGAALHAALRPTVERPRRDPVAAGVVPAALYLALAAAALVHAGPW